MDETEWHGRTLKVNKAKPTEARGVNNLEEEDIDMEVVGIDTYKKIMHSYLMSYR